MKKILLAFVLSVVGAVSFVSNAQEAQTFFPYPQVPEDKVQLSERCNYLVDKFWDRCNLKQSFSSLEKLNGALGDWLSFMPYATTDTVFPAIDRFLTALAKIGANEQATIAKMAEKWVYSDSATYFSEAVYYPFCKAVADNKKSSKADKAYFGRQARIIENSGLGKTMPSFEMLMADGSKKAFGDVIASRIIVIFVDPSMEGTMAKVRLAADYNLNKLIGSNLVKVVAVFPKPLTAEVKAEMEACPENWIVCAVPDAADNFDLLGVPSIYYLDAKHKVLGKNLSTEQLLVGLRAINQGMEQPQ